MTNEITLTGCRPSPLADYLKALGVLRIVGEQADPTASACWSDRGFVIKSDLDQDDLEDFLLRRYTPTALVSPWNGGSGLYPKDNKTGLDAILNSSAGRFASYAEAIIFGQRLVDEFKLDASPKGNEKAALLARFRATASPTMLTWFDAAIFLSTDEPRFPPLLGTGGNDGRLDFSNNFMQRLIELLDPVNGEPQPAASSWLSGALFNRATHGLASSAIGQFNPGSVGGPNAGTGFESGSLVNPWDFVLMLEGSLLFAAAASRRLQQTTPGGFGYPFTVRPTGAGGGSTTTGDEKNARAEIWMPLWRRPATLPEIAALLSEGRARLGRNIARDGLGFARSIAHFGTDRGIEEFERYGFLMRSGKAYLATPLGRFKVRRNAEADILGELDKTNFLDNLRRYARTDNAPGALRMQVHRIEEILLSLTRRSDPQRLQTLLVQIGRCTRLLGRSQTGREKVPYLPRLTAAWPTRCDDGSAEFRIAIALSTLHNGPSVAGGRPALLMAAHLLPVQPTPNTWQWLPGSKLNTWSNGTLVDNLAAVLQRRLIEAERRNLDDKPFAARTGASLADIATFLAGTADDRRIADLLAALVLCEHAPGRQPSSSDGEFPLPAAYRVLKPFFSTDSELRHAGPLPPDAKMPVPAELPDLVRGGRLNGPGGALQHAWRALAAHRWPLPHHPATPPSAAADIDGKRLLGALLIPVAHHDYRSLYEPLTRFNRPPNPSDNKGTPS